MFVIPVLNMYEIYTITGTFYAVNIGSLGIADPVVILQTTFASRDFAKPLLFSALFPVVLALLLGRIWCGWLCPYHLLSDCTAWVRKSFLRRILRRTEEEPFFVPSIFKANMIRYGFLILGCAVAGAIAIPVLNYVSAPGVLSTEAMILVREAWFSIEIIFIAVILLIELFLFPRFWCRLFCPTGSFLALFRLPFTLTVRSAASHKGACCKSRECVSACPMGLEPFHDGANLLCTNCGRCIDACRASGGPGNLGFSGFAGRDS
jgi:ferredoxin-type protein NapH